MAGRKNMQRLLSLPSDDRKVLLFRDPVLNLFVISDRMNMGPHIIRLTSEMNTFTTSYLLGGDESVCQAVRFLAPVILSGDEEQLDSGPNPFTRKEIIVSFCLKNPNRDKLCLIRDEIAVMQREVTSSPCGKCVFIEHKYMTTAGEADEINCRVLGQDLILPMKTKQ